MDGKSHLANQLAKSLALVGVLSGLVQRALGQTDGAGSDLRKRNDEKCTEFKIQ